MCDQIKKSLEIFMKKVLLNLGMNNNLYHKNDYDEKHNINLSQLLEENDYSIDKIIENKVESVITAIRERMEKSDYDNKCEDDDIIYDLIHDIFYDFIKATQFYELYSLDDDDIDVMSNELFYIVRKYYYSY